MYRYQAGTDAKMPFWLKILFSMPRYTIRAMYTVHALFVVSYYNGLGTDLSTIAFFIALGRSFDTLTDPFMGWITDATNTRIGRRKPYLLVGPIFYTLVIFLHVTPPASLYSGNQGAAGDGNNTGAELWFGLTYLAFFLCDTAASVPYYALKYELCTDNVERTKIFSYTILASFIGLLVGNAMPAGIVYLGAGPGAALLVTMLHFSIIYTMGMWGSALFITEPKAEEGAAVKKPISFPSAITRVLSTKAMIYFVASETLDYSVIYVFSAILSFYCNYVIIDVTGAATDYERGYVITGGLGLMGFFCSALSVPLWWRFYLRIGKRKAWMTQSLYNGFSNLLFLLPLPAMSGAFAYMNTRVILTLLFVLINAFAFGGQFLMDSTLADVIEYDEFLYGERIDGTFASTAYFVPKAVGAFASAMPLTLIDLSGFVKPLQGCPDPSEANYASAVAVMLAENITCADDDIRNQPQGAGTIWMVRLITGLLPAAASMAGLAFKHWFYLHPEQMDDIKAGIEKLSRDPSTPFEDPVTGQMVTWVTGGMLSEKDAELKRMLDFFPISQIERVASEQSFESMRRRAIRSAAYLIVFGIASITIAVVTVQNGWLTDNKLALVPIMSCICVGAGFTMSGIFLPRLVTALKLHSNYSGAAFPKELVGKMAKRFVKASGSSGSHLDEATTAIKQEL